MGVGFNDLMKSLLKFLQFFQSCIYIFFTHSHTFLILLLNHYMYTADQGNFLHSW
jgi:hypothetical protein